MGCRSMVWRLFTCQTNEVKRTIGNFWNPVWKRESSTQAAVVDLVLVGGRFDSAGSCEFSVVNHS